MQKIYYLGQINQKYLKLDFHWELFWDKKETGAIVELS